MPSRRSSCSASVPRPRPWCGSCRCRRRSRTRCRRSPAASWIVPSTESPSSTWLGANPEPELTSLRIRPHLDGDPRPRPADRPGHAEETLLKQEPVLGEFDPARYRTDRVWAHGRRRHHASRSRWCTARTRPARPCLLYGYGAYEISIDPSFSHHRLSLLDRGMVFAVAHVVAAVRWAGPGTRTGAWSTRPTRSATSSPAPRIWWRRDRQARRGGRAGGSAGGLLMARWPTRRPNSSPRWWPRFPCRLVTTMLDTDSPYRRRMEGVGKPAGGQRGLLADASTRRTTT